MAVPMPMAMAVAVAVTVAMAMPMAVAVAVAAPMSWPWPCANWHGHAQLVHQHLGRDADLQDTHQAQVGKMFVGTFLHKSNFVCLLLLV